MAIPTDFREEAETFEAQTLMRSNRRYDRFLYAIRHDPRWWLGLILLVFILAALLAPYISPHDPIATNPANGSKSPSLANLLGTDLLGRDQLSRVIWGTRISLSIGVAVILLGGFVGVILGIVAAYFQSWVDQLISIVIDAILSFPGLVLALGIVAALGPGIITLAVALAFVRIPIYARLARGQTLQAAAQDYVLAARVSGTPAWKIMARHILPNIISPIIVQATVTISFAIIDSSVLSFLGLGPQPPTPDWGSMVYEAQPYLYSDPWMMLGPSLAIVTLVLTLNLFGDAVRDLLDPRDATHVLTTKQGTVTKETRTPVESVAVSAAD